MLQELYRTEEQLAEYLAVSINDIKEAIKVSKPLEKIVAGTIYYNCAAQRKIADFIRKDEVMPDNAVSIEDLCHELSFSKSSIYEHAHALGIIQHSKRGTVSWYYPEEATVIKNYFQQRLVKKTEKKKTTEVVEIKKPAVKKRKKSDYWKLSVNLNGYYYVVKACCLTVDEALSIRDTLVTIGIDTRISKHIEPKFDYSLLAAGF